MSMRISSLCLALVASAMMSLPQSAFARGGGGGGGGGHGGGGGFGGGGGHFGGGGWGGRGYGGYRGYGWGGNRGWGWGGYRGYGWGYPYGGYGLGLGLGLGLGYGMYGGYGGYGYGGYGYGGYGYGGYGGYGYPGYGYGNYGYVPYGPAYNAYYSPTTNPSANAAVATPMQVDGSPAKGAASTSAAEFAERGETAFKEGAYKTASYEFRHAAVDDPHNPLLTMLLGQALFANGEFDEAAGATQSAMRQLPKTDWGIVVTHYKEIYGNSQDYTTHLRALEKAIKEKPGDPALRFLAGFHYAYLGFHSQAIDQLERGIKLAPQDEMAKQLRDEMRAKSSKPPPLPPAPSPALAPAAGIQGPAISND